MSKRGFARSVSEEEGEELAVAVDDFVVVVVVEEHLRGVRSERRP